MKRKRRVNIWRAALEEGGKVSTMRICALAITASFVALLGALAVHIIHRTFGGGELDWLGIGAFIGALSAPLMAVLLPKAQQRKHETAKAQRDAS